MRHSKTSGSSRRRRRSSSRDRRPRRYRSRSSSYNRDSRRRRRERDSKVTPQTKRRPVQEDSQTTAPPLKRPIEAAPEDIPIIINSFDDRGRLVEALYVHTTGPELQEIIPDYFKNRSVEELKQLCIDQAKLMSPGLLEHIASGKDIKSFDELPESKEKCKETKHQDDDLKKRKLQDAALKTAKKFKKENLESSPVPSEGLSSDTLELYPSSREMESIIDDENQALIKTEDIKTRIPESCEDLELLELQMRARAIKSLLKAKGLPSSDEENSNGN